MAVAPRQQEKRQPQSSRRHRARAAFFALALVAALVAALAATPFGGVAMFSNGALAAVRARNAKAAFPGRVALVVGGTAGIGRAVAERLADADYTVVIAGRDAGRGAEVVASCAGRGSKRGGHSFIACDASRIASVRAVAAAVAAQHPTLDALVLSQGIASIAGRTETPEGLDVKLTLHYFGRVEFIRQLLPALRAAPAPAVLSVLSAGVHSPYYGDDFELRGNYSLKHAADASGSYNDAALDALSREGGNERVAFIHAFPGFVATSWGTELPAAARGIVRCLQWFATPAANYAEFAFNALTKPRQQPSPGGAGGGGFFPIDSTGGAARTPKGHDDHRDAVWAKTRALLDRISA